MGFAVLRLQLYYGISYCNAATHGREGCHLSWVVNWKWVQSKLDRDPGRHWGPLVQNYTANASGLSGRLGLSCSPTLTMRILPSPTRHGDDPSHSNQHCLPRRSRGQNAARDAN